MQSYGPWLLSQTRRHFFSRCSLGLGQVALASLLSDGRLLARTPDLANPLAARDPHFPAKIRNVIYLYMVGGPSQLDLFDHKPKLQELDGRPIPDSFLKGKRFAFMDFFTKEKPRLLGSEREFKRYGQSGKTLSECLPHTASVVDDLAFVSTVSTDNFNHGPAQIFSNTGSPRPGKPSMGSWVSYGLGTDSQDLPAFVVLQSGRAGPRAGVSNWESGFLPTIYQGIPFFSSGDPILNLASPAGMSRQRQASRVEAIRNLNLARLAETGDPEIATRIASYEMAYRMQTSGPELIDFSSESQQTLDLYGAEPGARSFANNCLLARRLVERGVRFVQLYHAEWDHHGNAHVNLQEGLDKVTRETDRPSAALVRDLKQRGLLDSTLVVWGGEFGRTPMGEKRDSIGRNHHIDAYTVWFAGGGIRPGQTIGKTDELGFSAVEDPVHVHDIHATILHLLGLDHTRLTFRFQGREFRLTDVAGNVIEKLLA